MATDSFGQIACETSGLYSGTLEAPSGQMGQSTAPPGGRSRIPGPRKSGPSSVPGPGEGLPSRIPNAGNHQKNDGDSSGPHLSPAKPSSIPSFSGSARRKPVPDTNSRPANATGITQPVTASDGITLFQLDKDRRQCNLQSIKVRVRATSPRFQDNMNISETSTQDAGLVTHERLVTFASDGFWPMSPPNVNDKTGDSDCFLETSNDGPELVDESMDLLQDAGVNIAPSSEGTSDIRVRNLVKVEEICLLIVY